MSDSSNEEPRTTVHAIHCFARIRFITSSGSNSLGADRELTNEDRIKIADSSPNCVRDVIGIQDNDVLERPQVLGAQRTNQVVEIVQVLAHDDQMVVDMGHLHIHNVVKHV
jgi:hypothetical protein